MLVDGKQIRARSVALGRLDKDLIFVELGSSYTVPTSLSAVPGALAPLRAGATYIFEFDLHVATSGSLFGVTFSAALQYSGNASRFAASMLSFRSTTASQSDFASSFGALMTDGGGRINGGPFPTQIRGSIVTTTAGNLQLAADRGGSGTITLNPGTTIKLFEV